MTDIIVILCFLSPRKNVIKLLKCVSIKILNFCHETDQIPASGAERGGVIIAVFTAIALLGVLSAGLVTFIKGPLSTSIKLTKMNTAENQMSVGTQIAVLAASTQANNGDCDSDGFIEPVEWRAPSTEPTPIGGGLVPHSIGIQKKDPWGTEYGYCVWNHGSIASEGGCGLALLAGGSSTALPVAAIVSAGPDKTFSTTCRTLLDADENGDGDLLDEDDMPLISKSSPTDDDIIFSYTYNEAGAIGGDLWRLKSGDPGVATISKSIEISGNANIDQSLDVSGNVNVNGTGVFARLAASSSDFLQLLSGLKLASPLEISLCNLENRGVMRLNGAGTELEICSSDNSWQSISGSAKAFGTTSECALPSDAGKVRFNSSSSQPEFCDGTTWRSFVISNAAAYLIISPANTTSLNVDYGSSAVNSLATYRHSTVNSQVFTVTNTGQTTSSVLNTSVSSNNFEIISNTCNGSTLAALSTCDITIRPRASSNGVFTGVLTVAGNNTPQANLQGTASNFTCRGETRDGGVVVSCNNIDPFSGSTYDLIISPLCNGGSGASDTTCTPSIVMPFSLDATFRQKSAFQISQARTAGSHRDMELFTLNSDVLIPSGAPAYCENLTLNGYSDWYLPVDTEINSIGPAPPSSMGFTLNQRYWQYSLGMNNMLDDDTAWGYYFLPPAANIVASETDMLTNYPVRCMRRTNLVNHPPAATRCSGGMSRVLASSTQNASDRRTGEINEFWVKGGCTVRFKLWGAAGACSKRYSGTGIPLNYQNMGGPGGYATVTESPSVDTKYTVLVGNTPLSAYSDTGGACAGRAGGATENSTEALKWQGGSSGSSSNSAYICGGGGGGASVIYRGDFGSGTLLAVAAGGGGAGGLSAGKPGGRPEGNRSLTSTAGGVGANSTIAQNSGGGGGAGFDGATGGGGLGGSSPGEGGAGGANYVISGIHNTVAASPSSTPAASYPPGNSSDSYRNGAGNSDHSGCFNISGGFVMEY